MKFVDGWWWPDHERHMLDWLANQKNRRIINGRPAYQGKKQLAAVHYLPAEHRGIAIDVGAHVGLWSWNLAHWFKTVEAFEPVAAHRECWEKNMQPTPDGRAAKLWPCALGEREAMIAICTTDTSSGDSWIKGKGEIPMKPLDSFHFAGVDFIKIDCEGYEEFVLRGGAETIKRDVPVIIVEQKRDMATKFDLKPLGAVKLLQSWGYDIAEEISGDYIMVHG
jgi:FkbM family methyltransferase